MSIRIEDYWTDPPPEPSAGLKKWTAKIANGWTPNQRIRSMGYYTAAEFFGVYIWEYFNILSPLLQEKRS